ncbi:hypothetical protein [uncultured Veillonella sp.]|uniref:hypothetical protein n=1 Tax=uncultured Veillonella sp. TaxID=159268 RepID=UPI0025DF5E03|nr:hypothetical protein [uncultured Veillonella sp.]
MILQDLYEIESIRGADELLGPNVTDEIMEKAVKWLTYFAASLSVQVEEIEPSFVVTELITAYAMREVCIKKSYALGASVFNPSKLGSSVVDYFGQKLKYYESKIKELENRITAADLTGGKEGKAGYRSVALYRG